MAAKSERIAQSSTYLTLLCLVERKVQRIIELRILVALLVIDGRRHDVVLDTQYTCHSLHGTGSSSFWTWMNTYIFDTKSAFYIVCYFLLIIAFSYFYATIQFNPIEIANNLKKNGGFIPGFRPGKPTSDFILKVINKITLFGALYLAIVAILPIIVGIVIKNSSLAIGGTSVIIVVGVALETVKSLEAQMLMRHYKGFLE